MTQHDRLLNLLKSYNGAWVPLDKIMDLRIGQYNRVINDFRTGKHSKPILNIENKTEWIDGVCHSWYRLIEAPQEPVYMEEPTGQLVLF